MNAETKRKINEIYAELLRSAPNHNEVGIFAMTVARIGKRPNFTSGNKMTSLIHLWCLIDTEERFCTIRFGVNNHNIQIIKNRESVCKLNGDINIGLADALIQIEGR